ncbi:hypothetical protein MNBD_GAMMA05-1637 [hydrothermal vent metagenome]|uniref:Uncharacterized protein n=1 Tax=hydrothermal vent metagenome TaxID=652676 RepID=A0A3B0WXT3_9ZZZZ
MKYLFVLITVLFYFSSSASSSASAANGDDDIVDSLLQQAEQLQLAEHEIWYALLHYKRESFFRGFISQADDDDFFLAAEGKVDSKAELIANIKAFFRGQESRHAQCLFPARWWWVKQQLNISDEKDVSCPQLDAFMRKISQDKLFLVFPTMYLNNPGSTFGHTFLRFDDKDDAVLLSKTLNYAAKVKKTDDLVSYVAKGLFGGYSGIFRIKPYYKMVQEYTNIENRDIWEYQLDITPEEITQLVRHVWEVRGVNFDYYFFRENCSYRLLALLDVVRPGLQLTAEGDFPFYAIPVDTVRELENAGLIQSRLFRASLATQIDEFFDAEQTNSSAVVLTLLSEGTASDSQSLNKALQGLNTNPEKVKVLQQAHNILQFYGKSSSPKSQKVLKSLNALSSNAVSKKKQSKAIDAKRASPETGHDSMRIAAGYGEQNGQQYIDLRWRPAFHDLLDAPQGYVNGAAINIFDLRLKWFVDNESNNSLRLESLKFFNVTSLSPVSSWQTPISWMLDIRLDRTQVSKSQSLRSFVTRGGAGISVKKQAFMPFVLLIGEWNLSSDYRKGYSLLAGVQAGTFINYKTSQFELSFEKDVAVSGFELDKNILKANWQLNFQVNHAMRLQYRLIKYDFFDDEDWTVGYHYYF